MNKAPQPLSVYQRGALCWLAVRRRAKTDPNFSPLLDPEVFIKSGSWHRMKARRRYGYPEIREFLRGFCDASKVKAGPKDNLA